MATKKTAAVAATESKENEVMNQVIVRLNEFKAVKMANTSKSKRPAAKFNKEVATYLVDNWDNLENLKTCQEAMRRDMPHVSCEEVMSLYDERVKTLEQENEPAEAPQPETKVEETSTETAAAPKAQEPKKTSSKSNKKEDKKQAKAEPKTASEKKDDDAETKTRGRKSTLKVGDRHPNGKWIWTEYQPGRFDWRTDPALKKTPGAVRKADNGGEKSQPPKSQANDKKAAGKAGKQGKAAKQTAAPAKEKKLTLEELLAKPMPNGLSKSQQNAIKAMKRGYRLRIENDTYWLTNSKGENERTEKAVIEAIQRRWKIDYIPVGLMYKK